MEPPTVLRLPRADRPDPAGGCVTAVRPGGDLEVEIRVAAPVADADALALLDAAERRRHDRLRRDIDRARLVVGRRLLRHAIARRRGLAPADVEVRVAPPPAGGRATSLGRPVVPGGPRGVSIAHGGELVVVALSDDGAVGIDVEPASSRSRMTALADELLAAGEREALNARGAVDVELELLRAWTRKEAVLKAVGVGLTVSMRAIVLAADGSPRVAETSPALPDAGRFRLLDLDAGPEHVAALAVLRDGV